MATILGNKLGPPVAEKLRREILVLMPIPSARVIPLYSPLDSGEIILRRILLARIEGREEPVLEEHTDGEFLAGAYAATGNEYFDKVRKRLKRWERIRVTVEEER